MRKAIFLLSGLVALFFNSCMSTNKSFQSSPVIARNVELDPIKADIQVDGKKLHGEGSVTNFLIFRVGASNTQFADGINYSLDSRDNRNIFSGFKGMFNGAGKVAEAKSATAYKALQQAEDSDYDILVHPSYEITKKNYLWLYRKFTVKVSGYGGKYVNFRTEKQRTIILSTGQEYEFPDQGTIIRRPVETRENQ